MCRLLVEARRRRGLSVRTLAREVGVIDGHLSRVMRRVNYKTPGLDVRLDVSTTGQSFLAQVASNALSLVRARTGRTLSAQNCVVLKNSSGVKCPPPAR